MSNRPEHQNMKPTWMEQSRAIDDRFIAIAQTKGNLKSTEEITRFLSLAICGEAAELANLVKKLWRGDDVSLQELKDEAADIRIYLEHLAHHLDFDLDEACNRKVKLVKARLDAKEKGAETR